MHVQHVPVVEAMEQVLAECLDSFECAAVDELSGLGETTLR